VGQESWWLMSKLDWKHGRWGPDAETDLIFKAMRGWADRSGDWIDYYRFSSQYTSVDPVYDEASGEGRIYSPRVRIKTLHNTLIFGENQNTDMGFYFNDSLETIIAFDQFANVVMSYPDILASDFTKDRIYYNQKVFRVLSVNPRGKIQQRPTIIHISSTQLKPDELVDDQIFAQWSQPVNGLTLNNPGIAVLT
jgi:hypothetical protein